MQHNYTIEQLRETIDRAKALAPFELPQIVSSELEYFLDALPEPGWLQKLQEITTDQDSINERLEQAYKLEAAQVPSQVFRTLIRMTLSGKIFIDDLRVFASDGIQLDDQARQEVATFWDKRHALPEPQDDWQQCLWDDILHTDERVKAEYISGTIIEGVPDGISDNGVYLVDGNLIPYSTDAKWYRIPATVTHPDPAEHPVIIVHLYNGVKETKRAFVWNGDSYGCLDGPYSFLTPHQITDWEPAKVVADNDC